MSKTLWLFILLVISSFAQAAFETRQTLLVSQVPVVSVSEAPEGVSDHNWVVGNVANGVWGSGAGYPDQQWMARHISETG